MSGEPTPWALDEEPCLLCGTDLSHAEEVMRLRKRVKELEEAASGFLEVTIVFAAHPNHRRLWDLIHPSQDGGS